MSREFLTKLYNTAIDSIRAETIVTNNVKIDGQSLILAGQRYEFSTIKNLYIYAAGKAALPMAQQAEKILADRIQGGLVVTHQQGALQYLKTYQSTHPLVSGKSLQAAEMMQQEFTGHNRDDFFIFFLSGGASAMLEQPIQGLGLAEFQKISKALLISGIDINALNTVRKAISNVKGGKLAEHTQAQGVVLVLSDVVGDDLQTIGSAPMYNGRYNHHIIGNNTIALQAIEKYLQKQKIPTEIITTTLNGSSQLCSDLILKEIEKNQSRESYCLLFGGESVTEPKMGGIGGRNQELALRLMTELPPQEGLAVLCAGSDGIDGNSVAAGAFFDKNIYPLIEQKNLKPKEYLDNSNSYLFFHELGYDLTTGATGTNVMDIIIVLKSKNM